MKSKSLFAVLAFALINMLTTTASAEVIPGTNLSIDFHSGHVVGAGRNINMIRVPVTDINTGQTTLWDATFKFTFLPNQGFVFEEISSAATSQPGSIANITPGLYLTQFGTCYLLEGPTLLNSSRSLYTLRGTGGTVSGKNCGSGDRFSAQIVSGPAAGHPDIGGRDIVPSLTENWVYGFVSDSGGLSPRPININWQQNELIGVRQSGDQLIVGLFSEEGADFKDPKETAILTRASQ